MTYKNEYDPFGEENWDEVESDGSFLTWLKINYPDETKWSKIKEINCSSNQLTNLEGIENLTNLTHLYCSNNQLTDLEGIENLRKLKHLNCHYNQLTALPDLSANTALQYLNCKNNQLTILPDLSANISLQSFSCSNNQLINLNITNGSNTLILTMNAKFNKPALIILVDNAADATAGIAPYDVWTKDASATYN